MAFSADENQAVISTPAESRENLRRVRYTVSDLTGNDKAAADRLALLMLKLISPQSWQAAGGQGTIETEKSALVVEQSPDVHDQILVFCEKLRGARALPFKSDQDPRRFDLTIRLAQAAPALKRPVSANFHEPATLAEELSYLARQADVDILVDHQALAAAGVSDKTEVSFSVEKLPFGMVLDELLAALRLGYRVVDAHTIQVTSRPGWPPTWNWSFIRSAKYWPKVLPNRT